MVRFICPGCEKVLKIQAAKAGGTCRCPRCSSRLVIPSQPQALSVTPLVYPAPESYPMVLPAPKKQATVPLKLAMPKNLGGMETTVSQGTANSVVKVATGGFLVALGVVVAAMFGIRRPGA